jgi:hypothetical protein
MKLLYIFGLVFLFSIGIVNATTLYYNGFETNTTNWIEHPTYASYGAFSRSNTYTTAGTYALKMDDTSTSGYYRVYQDLSLTETRIVYDFDIYVELNSESFQIAIGDAYNAASFGVITTLFTDGSFNYYNSSSLYEYIDDLSSATWYNFVYDIDVSSDTWDLYIDGDLVLDDIDTFGTASNTYDTFVIGSSYAKTELTNLWIDEFYVYDELPVTGDDCDYSGTGNWIIDESCHVDTNTKLQLGYSMIVNDGATVIIDSGVDVT